MKKKICKIYWKVLGNTKNCVKLNRNSQSFLQIEKNVQSSGVKENNEKLKQKSAKILKKWSKNRVITKNNSKNTKK